MYESTDRCEGREGCHSEATHACSCGVPVVFLCSDCVINHLKEPFTHSFIPLEQAHYMKRSLIFDEKFIQDLDKYSSLKASIQTYIHKIHSFKEKLEIAKIEVQTILIQEFQSKLKLLNDLETNAIQQLSAIRQRLTATNRFGEEELYKFNTEGLPGIIQDYVEDFNISTYGMRDTIRGIFSVSYAGKAADAEEAKDSDLNLIYYTQRNSKNLMSYNIDTHSVSPINLSSSASSMFNNSSTYILPDGNLMIVGSFVPTHGETYRFNVKTGQCIRLRSLNNPRGLVGLICHDKYLYAIGGCKTTPSKKVERMEWSGNGWRNLPDMKQGRFYVGLVCLDYRIYVIGGANVTSVEYYDIKSNRFYEMSLQVPTGSNMAVMVDDEVYILGSKIVVMNGKMEIVESIIPNVNMMIDCFNSPVVIEKKVYFHSSNSAFILEFDTETRMLREVMPSYA